MMDDEPIARVKLPEESPNKSIDRLLTRLLKKAEAEPTDVAVKVVNSAVAWEKVKHGILDKADDFDPDAL